MKVLALMLLLAATPDRVSTLYDRVAARLAADPKLAQSLGEPTSELRAARWMVGTWDVTSRVFATPQTPERTDKGRAVVTEILGGTWLQLADSYDGREQDRGFLTYNAPMKRWISIGIDKTGNGVTAIAEKWEGNRLAFIAESVDIVGERVTLRQTIEKRSDREYRLLNEERLSDGTWAAVDEYVYTKR
jgi:hypothetical protein